MVDFEKDLMVQNTLSSCSTKWLPLYQFIRANSSRIGLLVKVGTTKPATIEYIAKRTKSDRTVVSKCINALIKEDLLKKDKRQIYLDPMCYLPLVNDFELRCLMERYNDGFIKPLEDYRQELLELHKQAIASAKREIGIDDYDVMCNTKEVIKEVKQDEHFVETAFKPVTINKINN